MKVNTRTYVRSASGKVVHRSGCRRTGRLCVPWLYADRMSATMMSVLIARTPWLKACKVCRPDKDEP